MKKTKSRILASFVAVMLCFTAFSTVALANGNDPEAKPETTTSTEQAEETKTPTTGGIEDTADTDENVQVFQLGALFVQFLLPGLKVRDLRGVLLVLGIDFLDFGVHTKAPFCYGSLAKV